jgi:hypothetical protein
MTANNGQQEDIFIAAAEQVSSGRSVDAVLRELSKQHKHSEHGTEIEPMLRSVASIKEMPTPALPPGSMARIERRAQLAAANRRRAATGLNETRGAHAPILKLVRSPREKRVERASLTGSLFERVRAILARPATAPWKIASAGAVLATVVLAVLVMTGVLIPQNQPVTRPQQLESYGGTIRSIEPGRWILADEAEVYVDELTEIHGVPALGAQMTCLAEQLPEELPGQERYRALEVWVLSAPNSPADPKSQPDGSSPSPRASNDRTMFREKAKLDSGSWLPV